MAYDLQKCTLLADVASGGLQGGDFVLQKGHRMDQSADSLLLSRMCLLHLLVPTGANPARVL